MEHSVNGARGEVALRIGNVDLVIAAEIERLAALSTAIECRSLYELYARLFGVEPAATVAGIKHLTVKGDAAAALRELKLHHFGACKDAFAAALDHHLDDDAGKGEAAGEAATTSLSPGATG